MLFMSLTENREQLFEEKKNSSLSSIAKLIYNFKNKKLT